MIISYRAVQGKGKTSLMVVTVKQVLFNSLKYENGYRTTDVVANLSLPKWDGAVFVSNAGMRKYLEDAIGKGIEHKIIMITEADRVFPARFWNKAGQTEGLIGLWQDQKCFNLVLWDAHEGTGTDIILRSVTNIEVVPEYDKFTDATRYIAYNDLFHEVARGTVDRLSCKVWQDYDRWQKAK